jgi:hypothetical protein
MYCPAEEFCLHRLFQVDFAAVVKSVNFCIYGLQFSQLKIKFVFDRI